ncbi:HEAT repeat domain-containing protein [Dactylosporangium vinaceum]|uniref:HEAT repeat domain-containing protein n=1 Tax=Dactylosporangium vinaceum TaxID=53362 RepID=A0ABV5MSY4_9ACTN|nr:HEAT repeat domain-containing protein [Dactylosporangium vinaceum]UAB97690.1 HEAT repeat domain-containing protein [Dactylosporangium vinaceum]
MVSVYVSSTFEDLKDERQAVVTAVLRLRGQVRAMEHYVADSAPVVAVCLEDVARCDVYVGIFAWRYGTIVPDLDKSITELEYRQAVDTGKPCLIFLLHPDAPWPRSRMDYPDAERIVGLREELSKSGDRIVSFFKSKDDLAAQVTAALAHEMIRIGSMPPNRHTLDGEIVQVYLRRLEHRYSRLNLNSIALPEREDRFEVTLADIFVEQSVRREPPPSELPRDWLMRMVDEGQIAPENLQHHKAPDEIAHLRELYFARPRQRLFDAVCDPGHRTMVLLGDPGAGKSTVAGYLMLVLARARSDDRLSELVDHLPLIVELREYDQMLSRRECDDFLSYLDQLAERKGLGLPKRDLRQYLDASGRTLAVFDGLDEIFDHARRDAVARSIAEFADAFASARVIVTSRIIGYSRGTLTGAGFAHFALQDLDDGQIEDFLGRWFPRMLSDQVDEPAHRRSVLMTIRESNPIRELAGNPLLLTILAIISRVSKLPGERWKLYDHATDVLVARWNTDRGPVGRLPAGVDLNATNKKEMLQRLARRMQGDGSAAAVNYVGPAALGEVFAEYLVDEVAVDAAVAREHAEAMVRQLHERDFILSQFGPDLYSFVHRAFLEFFCAESIIGDFGLRRSMSFDALHELYLTHWTDASWREVLRLVASKLYGPHVGDIITQLINLPGERWPAREFASAPWNLALATQCLAEMDKPSQAGAAAAQLLDRLIMLLEHCVAIDDRDTLRLIEDEILPAARRIGPDWPGRDNYRTWYVRRGGRLLCSPVTEYAARLAAILSGPDDDIGKLFSGLEGLGDSRAAYALVAGLSELAVRARPSTPAVFTESRVVVIRDQLIGQARSGPFGLVRVAAVHALGENFDFERHPQVVTVLRTLAADTAEPPAIRAAAIRELRAAFSTDAQVRPAVIDCARADAPSVRRAALELLGRLGGADIAELLLERVREDDDPEAVRLAVEALIERYTGGDDVFRALVGRLGPEQPAPLRRMAVQLLDEVARRPEIRGPLERLVREDADATVFRAAADALAEFGDAAATVRDAAIDRARGDRYDAVRLAAMQVIAARYATDTAARQMLLERVAQDANPVVRETAVRILGEMAVGDAAIGDALEKALFGDTSPEVRRAAMQALTIRLGLNPASRVDIIGRARLDEDPGVRLAIVQAMSQRRAMTPQAQRLFLNRARHDPSERIRLAAVRVLAPQHEDLETFHMLIDIVRTDLDGDVVRAAVRAVRGVADERVRKALLSRFRTPRLDSDRPAGNSAVRRVVVQILADEFATAPDVRRELANRVADDPDPGVVEAAASGLAQSGGPSADLAQRLDRRLADPAVRRVAACSLIRWFGDDVEIQRRVAGLFSDFDAESRREVLAALIELPEPAPEVCATLEDATRDSDWTVQITAVRALGERFGERPGTVELLKSMARADPVGELGLVVGQVITCLPGSVPGDLPDIPDRRD